MTDSFMFFFLSKPNEGYITLWLLFPPVELITIFKEIRNELVSQAEITLMSASAQVVRLAGPDKDKTINVYTRVIYHRRPITEMGPGCPVARF